jgi:hypothetical protein
MIRARSLYSSNAVLGILLHCLLPLSGCAGAVDRNWSEEVGLDGGKVITIDRHVKFRESNSFAGDAYNSTDIESRLSFTGEHSSLPAWRVALVPVLLYRDKTADEWVIVATTSNCDTWYQKGGPVPPYWEYRLTGGQWQESKLSEASLGRKTNLFFNYEPKLPARTLTRQVKDEVIKRNAFAELFLSVTSDSRFNCGYAPK